MTRVRRISGQAQALERALEGEHDCFKVLQQIASIRGAVNGLMTDVIEGHVQEHIAHIASAKEREQGAAELMAILRSYLK